MTGEGIGRTGDGDCMMGSEDIEKLRLAGQHLLDMIDTQNRGLTPAPKRETEDDANSRDERDQVFGDAVERFRVALKEMQP